MAAYETNCELVYGQSPADTLADLEKALRLIGQVLSVDPGSGIMKGKTKYGLNPVAIEIRITPEGDSTRIHFSGRSGDIGAVGAQKGIENLIATLQDLDNPSLSPSKTGGVRPARVILMLLEFILAVVIVYGWRTESMAGGLLVTLLVVWLLLLAGLIWFWLKAAADKRG